MLLPFVALGAYENSGKTNATAISVAEIMQRKRADNNYKVEVRKLDTEAKSGNQEWLIVALLVAVTGAAIYFSIFHKPKP